MLVSGRIIINKNSSKYLQVTVVRLVVVRVVRLVVVTEVTVVGRVVTVVTVVTTVVIDFRGDGVAWVPKHWFTGHSEDYLPTVTGFRQAPMGTVDRVNGHLVVHVWHFTILDSFARKNPFRMVVLGSQTSI